MNFKKIIYSDVGKIIISVLLGIGLSCLFHKVCKDKNCIKFSGPVIQNIEGKIFKQADKCYSYKLQTEKCNTNKQIVEFE
jgi:hypothetical protein